MPESVARLPDLWARHRENHAMLLMLLRSTGLVHTEDLDALNGELAEIGERIDWLGSELRARLRRAIAEGRREERRQAPTDRRQGGERRWMK